jgi:putative acetyltransferase
MIEIRREQPGDIGSIREVHVLAFGGDAEAQLVDLLRKRNKASVSLVAVSQHRVVGHILFSPISISSAPQNFRGLGLAPLAVLPEFQNLGIGSQLTRVGLELCREANYDLVVVLGHEHYYPRFGFSRAKDHGLDNEYGAVDAFMVLELVPGTLQKVGGLVQYAPEFRETAC